MRKFLRFISTGVYGQKQQWMPEITHSGNSLKRPTKVSIQPFSFEVCANSKQGSATNLLLNQRNVITAEGSFKARLHMRFLMRFLALFRVQNAPYPTLHECFFREASRGLGRKLSHIISFQFLLTWRYFVAELRDYKPVRGRLWQVLYAKSHRNHIFTCASCLLQLV